MGFGLHRRTDWMTPLCEVVFGKVGSGDPRLVLAVKGVSPCGGHPGQCTQGGFVFVFHTTGPRCGVFGVHARGPRCGVFGVPCEGASLWRVWVSMRGGLVVACLGVHARGPRCGVFGCPCEGASLWRVWVSMRGGLVVAYLGHTRGSCEGRL